MIAKAATLFCMVLSLGLVGCNYGPESPRGFSLPKGDIAVGEKVFMKYQCLSCHSLKGYEDESLVKEFSQPVPLGGATSIVKTYGQLVTSIINPSHKLAPRSIHLESVKDQRGDSKMRVFNDVMTVGELVDLVAFLQPQYEVKPIQYTTYGQYRVP